MAPLEHFIRIYPLARPDVLVKLKYLYLEKVTSALLICDIRNRAVAQRAISHLGSKLAVSLRDKAWSEVIRPRTEVIDIALKVSRLK